MLADALKVNHSLLDLRSAAESTIILGLCHSCKGICHECSSFGAVSHIYADNLIFLTVLLVTEYLPMEQACWQMLLW